jgi:hypothetical protein
MTTTHHRPPEGNLSTKRVSGRQRRVKKSAALRTRAGANLGLLLAAAAGCRELNVTGGRLALIWSGFDRHL